MPELREVQRRFGAALADAARADDAAPLFVGDVARVRERIAIYRGNVIANATKALAAAYPIIGKLVGAEFFGGLARAYCRAHPSASGDLNEFGAHFAEFLAAFPHARSLPYLPDVARLEWLAQRAHYAADHAPLDTGRLEKIGEYDYLSLALKLHPAVGVLESAYPICRIWEVHQDDYGGEVAVDLASGPQRAIVYRPGFRVTVAALSLGELAFLIAIQHGERLGAALESTLAVDAEFNLGVSLRRWIATRIVVELSVNI